MIIQEYDDIINHAAPKQVVSHNPKAPEQNQWVSHAMITVGHHRVSPGACGFTGEST